MNVKSLYAYFVFPFLSVVFAELGKQNVDEPRYVK